MSQLTETSATARDVVHHAHQAVTHDVTSAAPVVITEQEVLFGTRAALSPRVAWVPRRLIDAIRSAAASLQLPPPRQHYWRDSGYLEQSRMGREMERL